MNDSGDNIALEEQTIESEPESQVSFAGATLRLDSHQDAIPIITAIQDCPNLKFFNLEGNTLGVEAAEAISDALASKHGLKHAILKDIFTGRLKTEVPPAVRSLMKGILSSSARLVEIDLSDNAFGPIGMEALAPFLESDSCEDLKILRLNNNGLGIGGGKILGRALNNLKNLEVFVCGRNRLENPGAKEIGASLSNLDNLRHIEMPQNGINLAGIEALSEAIKQKIEILNLSDNTMTIEGGRIIGEALRKSKPKLKHVNFSDCLLKKGGFSFILEAMKDTGILESLEWLDVSGNEIGGEEAVDLLVKIFGDPSKNFTGLTLNLSSNVFGEENCSYILDELNDKVTVILEEDEGDQEEYEYPDDYLEDSTDTGGPRVDEISEEIRELVEDEETTLDQLCSAFVKITIEGFNESTSSLPENVLKGSEMLIKRLIEKGPSYESAQSLLSHLGLIKSEEGYHKKTRDLRGPFIALINCRSHLKKVQVDALQFSLGRIPTATDATGKLKHKLMQALFT